MPRIARNLDTHLSRSRYRTAMLITIIGLVLGCAVEQSDGALSVANVLADKAVAALPYVEPRSQRVHAAGETAVALSELSRKAQAGDMIGDELKRASSISDAAEKAIALVGLAQSSAQIGGAVAHDDVMTAAWQSLNAIDAADKKSDLTGKLLRATAIRHADQVVLDAALAMPELNENQSSYKARTLHELAPTFAEQIGVASGEAILRQITMGLAYYKAGAFADVAAVAYQRNQPQVAVRLLIEAEAIARAQGDGYFRAGALRRIASSYNDGGETETAIALFRDAGIAASAGESAQQRARALSRVATTLADHHYYSMAGDLLSRAADVAESEENEQLRFWTFYEIAGAAAFAGQFELADTLLAQIPVTLKFSGSHVRYAAERDIAWGYAKHERFDEASMRADAIQGVRERAQALARIARLKRNPKMRSLSRYL